MIALLMGVAFGQQPKQTQSPAAAAASTDAQRENTVRQLPAHIWFDQKRFWTTPLRMDERGWIWLAAGAGTTAVLITQDRDISGKLVSHPDLVHRSNQFSNAGIVAGVGMAGGAYLFGVFTKDEHKRETGFLSGEAAVNTLIVTEPLKYITRRDRPDETNGKGAFWAHGTSFPSEHSAAAWSIATVFAHEYPGPLTKVLAYGGAAAISATRVTGRKHFSSDAFVGSVLGYVIGRQVYRAHHSTELPGADWGEFVHDARHVRTRSHMGSPDDCVVLHNGSLAKDEPSPSACARGNQ